MASLYQVARDCLRENAVEDKCRQTALAGEAWRRGELDAGNASASPPPPPPEDIAEAGQPDRPRLVHPRELPKRRLSDPLGHAALIHAIAHIEFNAINLAWDAVYRFRDMPLEYYRDWVKVADEEARHFCLLRDHLLTLGYAYGDFDAHNGLWDMAKRTAGDVLVRMALVPRVLEARGLDVTPGMMERLRTYGDTRGVEILRVIFRDEIGHVAIGTRWFRWCCEQRGLDPLLTFRELLREYFRGDLRGPFDHVARRRAGFSEAELKLLESL